MAKTFEIEVTVPEGMKEGDSFVVTVEMPISAVKQRGQLHGIALADMTDEQLKREIINANSVLYKAGQRGAAAETIAANQARVDAAKAEKELRQPAPTVAVAAPVEGEAAPKKDKKNKKEATDVAPSTEM